MTYRRFEDLPVWQEAAKLYEQTEELLQSSDFKGTSGIRDRLDRAALSVSNNIAEGVERGTTNELLQFIYIARGSVGEVRSMLTLKLRRLNTAGGPAHLESQISNLKSAAEICSRQLRGWADSLQNSEIKGQRHLNERVRMLEEQKREVAAVKKRLLENLPESHRFRRKENDDSVVK